MAQGGVVHLRLAQGGVAKSQIPIRLKVRGMV